MKRLAIALILGVALLSCSDAYYGSYGEGYEEVYTNEIYEAGQPTINIVFTYGTPYYYGDVLYYYLYNDWYYYPYYYRGHWYYHRYHRPLPPPHGHHGLVARPGRPGSAHRPDPRHFSSPDRRHPNGGHRTGSGNVRPNNGGHRSGAGVRPEGGHRNPTVGNSTRRPSGGSTARPTTPRRPSTSGTGGSRIGSSRPTQSHSSPSRPNGGGRRH